MKGRWRHLERNKPGTVNLTPEDTEDIWSLYNIVAIGDEVETVTLRYPHSPASANSPVPRKVQLENSSGTTVDTQKIKLVLAVKTEKVDIDLAGGCLRVNGRNVKENKHVKVSTARASYQSCLTFSPAWQLSYA